MAYKDSYYTTLIAVLCRSISGAGTHLGAEFEWFSLPVGRHCSCTCFDFHWQYSQERSTMILTTLAWMPLHTEAYVQYLTLGQSCEHCNEFVLLLATITCSTQTARSSRLVRINWNKPSKLAAYLPGQPSNKAWVQADTVTHKVRLRPATRSAVATWNCQILISTFIHDCSPNFPSYYIVYHTVQFYNKFCERPYI